MSGYDIHLIIKHLAAQFPENKLTLIAENNERYISVLLHLIVGEYRDKHGKMKSITIELRVINL